MNNDFNILNNNQDINQFEDIYINEEKNLIKDEDKIEDTIIFQKKVKTVKEFIPKPKKEKVSKPKILKENIIKEIQIIDDNTDNIPKENEIKNHGKRNRN